MIEHVALYGADLPPAGQAAFVRRAAEASETEGVAAGWAEGHLQATLEQHGGPRPAGPDLSEPDIATSNGATICDTGRT